MSECKIVMAPVHDSDEDEAFVEAVHEVLDKALERELRRRGWLLPHHGPEPAVPVCRARVLSCNGELFEQLTTVLTRCAAEFYKICDFDHIRRICPFDPAWDAFEWKQQDLAKRLEELEVHVTELQAKLPAHK